MRIKAVQLEWFRGAADLVSLDADSRSIVVYGQNASGKSSFVDVIEYVLNDARIGHLAHEYSGKHQERAVPNTHTPVDRATVARITMADDSDLTVNIHKDGSSTMSGGAAASVATWDYRRTVLRQDEVARFIHDTKGVKYSALLPLLGLQRLEVAAENLRQLSKVVEGEARVGENTDRLKQLGTRRKATFGADTDSQILSRIQQLHIRYCADKSATADPLSRCKELVTALDARISSSSADQRQHVILQEASVQNLRGYVGAVRSASAKLAGVVEPLIIEKMGVLMASAEFGKKLGDQEEVTCPACGRPIHVSGFRAHIEAEQARLKEIIGFSEMRNAAIGMLCDSLRVLRSNLGKAEVKSWRDEITKGPLTESWAALDAMAPDAIRTSCGEDDLKTIESKVLPLVDAAACACIDAPPEAKELATDKRVVEVVQAVIEAKDVAAEVERSKALIAFIDMLEHGVREEIRVRSQKVIEEISADVQTMWAILHPGKVIEDVRLYLPAGADKAIDIGLRFHGIEQESPRLTLSEGYRNSLGLCIFLAMAKREAGQDRPIFLDDVVVSLDRNHRGMIRELLEKEFGGRQVIILTHDREWYTELRQQLDNGAWVFRALLPYETPALGIRWSHKTTTFGDARAQLDARPDSAGNDVRKIMDIELALIAESLQIRMPYARAERNDRRMAHDFLERLVADGKRCFEVRGDEGYKPHASATAALEEAEGLLVTWGNRGSHSFDVVRAEAAKLIAACEVALDVFKCSLCGRDLWFADAQGSEWVQCQCGSIRWKYGKG